MKILVYTGFDSNPNYQEVGRLAAQNKLDYANKHGYDFLCVRNYENFNRPVSWAKIPNIRHQLTNYDWIFWSDADVVITNFNIKLEDIIEAKVERTKTVRLSPVEQPTDTPLPELFEQHYIIAQDDYSPCMGNLLIDSSQWSRCFLVELEKYTNVHLNNNIWENRSQDYIFYNSPFWMQGVKFVPQKMINSMLPCWTPGDFLIHFPATEEPRRTRLMKEYLGKVIQ